MADPVDIKITSTFDGKGTTAAEAGLKGVGSAAAAATTTTKAAGVASEKTGAQLRGMSQYGAAGTQILQGLNQAASGGINSVLGLAAAIRGVIAAVVAGTGPIGIAVAAAGVVLGALFALIGRGTKESSDSFEDAAEAAKKLGATRLEGLKNELAGITAAAQETLDKLKEAIALQERIAKADQEKRAAERNLDPSLSPEGRARGGVQDKLESRLRQIDNRETAAKAEAEGKAATAAALLQQEEQARNLAAAAQAQADKAKRDQEEIDRLRKQEPRTVDPYVIKEILGKIADIERRNPADARARAQPIADTLTKEQIAATEARVKADKEAADAAQRAADESRAAAAEREAARASAEAEVAPINRAAADKAISRAAEEARKAEAAGIGRDVKRGVAGLGTNDEARALVGAVEQAASALEDGATTAELAALERALERLVAAAKEAGSGQASRFQEMLAKVEQRIQRLEQNNRTGARDTR